MSCYVVATKTPLLYYELLVVLHSQTLVYLASCAIVVIFLSLWDHHNVNVYYYSIFVLSLKSFYNGGLSAETVKGDALMVAF